MHQTVVIWCVRVEVCSLRIEMNQILPQVTDLSMLILFLDHVSVYVPQIFNSISIQFNSILFIYSAKTIKLSQGALQSPEPGPP